MGEGRNMCTKAMGARAVVCTCTKAQLIYINTQNVKNNNKGVMLGQRIMVQKRRGESEM